jgi:wyosine [tRNA(Phe)-imidazoG37] synthetase (radical SAM superfamily)
VSATRRLDFRDHRRSLSDNRYIYAVISRRARGLSIGVNLNPDKACNFDCPYCQVDRSLPSGDRQVDPLRLGEELDALLGLVTGGMLWEVPPFDTAEPDLRRVSDIAFAGDGEPTACPTFVEALRVVGEVRQRRGLGGIPLHLLTNATLFHRPRVAEGLRLLDALGGQIWAKLDAGTEAWFRRVDGTRSPFRRILDNLLAAARERPIVVQSMFVTLAGEAPPETELNAWARRLAEIREGGGSIAKIQVYTLARPPADATVGALDLPALEAIAARAAALGFSVEVYGAPAA